MVNDQGPIERLRAMRAESRLGGGQARIDQQHARGKLTARERLDLLLDPGSFIEFDAFVVHRSSDFGLDEERILGDGVVTGHGTIDGRLVFVFSQDFTVFGGSLSETHAEKICKIDGSRPPASGRPSWDSTILAARGSRKASCPSAATPTSSCAIPSLPGSCPRSRSIMGPCAGGAVYSPAITDVTIMVEGTSYMFVTGPEVVKAVTHEDVDREHLGGASIHTQVSGVAHLAAPDEAAALDVARRILSHLPQNNLSEPPRRPGRSIPSTGAIAASTASCPMTRPSPMTCTASSMAWSTGDRSWSSSRCGPRTSSPGSRDSPGHSVGVVAQQPAVLAGALDIDASDKAARFVRMCDAFNVPLLTLEDVPGFLPGVTQEHGGIIRHGAKLLYAYCEATVPKVTVITRKAYGGAYDVMSSKHVRGDVNLAWPTARIAVMGAEGAVKIIFRDELAQAEDQAAKLIELTREYEDTFANPYVAAGRGYVDDVIMPSETRPRVISAFRMLEGKRDRNPSRKHGNIPL